MKRYFASGGLASRIDKAPRLSIRRVIWILPSDTVFVNSTKISSTNSETAMLSIQEQIHGYKKENIQGNQINVTIDSSRPG